MMATTTTTTTTTSNGTNGHHSSSVGVAATVTTNDSPTKVNNNKATMASSSTSSTSSVNIEPDVVMMTPLKKELDHTILRVERLPPNQTDATGGGGGGGQTRHVAGGQHQGIIVNKQLTGSGGIGRPYDLRLAFKVFLVNAITQIHQQECRELRFWFQSLFSDDNSDGNDGNSADVRMQCAQQFFRALVNPVDFPKNYVGFIMKLMKTMQQPIYRPLVQIELEVRSIDEPFDRPPSAVSSRPSSVDESSLAAMIPLTEEKVLEMIEAAYPNPLSLSDLANTTRSTPEEVHHLVLDLTAKGVARLTDTSDAVVRITSDERAVKRVRQMPQVVRSQQPTVAIITAQFCEKLAVDSMIENKDTYVRYKVEGESNVYTLGNIGQHRVVATKLPAVGNSRSAMIAAGNTTTRLLGTFQHVEYVFLVGIGGGVPHYTDYRSHVRLGDVVVSVPPNRRGSGGCGQTGNQQQQQRQSSEIPLPNGSTKNGSPTSSTSLHFGNGGGQSTNRSDYVYVHCEKLRSSPDEPLNASNSAISKMQTVDSFNYRFWCPYSLELQDIAQKIYAESRTTPHHDRSWEQYLTEAREKLRESDDLDFARPDASTDKLYMSIGTGDVIEMAHPEPDNQIEQGQEEAEEEEEYDPRRAGMPRIHFGAIGSGRMAVGNEQLRQDIALKYGIKAFDIEFDTVIESIFGNRKDRYIIIRGVADYKDGSRKKEWQPYSALAAAAYMKAILCRLEPMNSASSVLSSS